MCFQGKKVIARDETPCEHLLQVTIKVRNSIADSDDKSIISRLLD